MSKIISRTSNIELKEEHTDNKIVHRHEPRYDVNGATIHDLIAALRKSITVDIEPVSAHKVGLSCSSTLGLLFYTIVCPDDFGELCHYIKDVGVDSGVAYIILDNMINKPRKVTISWL